MGEVTQVVLIICVTLIILAWISTRGNNRKDR
nr:MAG TPA: Hok/gef family [Caudoviricetes sp.]